MTFLINGLWVVFYFARAAMTKYLSLKGLNDRNVFSYSSLGLKSKIRVSAGLVSPEACLLGLQMTSMLCLHMAFSLCIHITGTSASLEGYQSFWIEAPLLYPHVTLIIW